MMDVTQLAAAIASEILDVGLRESTFREMWPRAFDELCGYRHDIELCIKRILDQTIENQAR
jgi:hypothetical protein